MAHTSISENKLIHLVLYVKYYNELPSFPNELWNFEQGIGVPGGCTKYYNRIP